MNSLGFACSISFKASFFLRGSSDSFTTFCSSSLTLSSVQAPCFFILRYGRASGYPEIIFFIDYRISDSINLLTTDDFPTSSLPFSLTGFPLLTFIFPRTLFLNFYSCDFSTTTAILEIRFRSWEEECGFGICWVEVFVLRLTLYQSVRGVREGKTRLSKRSQPDLFSITQSLCGVSYFFS